MMGSPYIWGPHFGDFYSIHFYYKYLAIYIP